MSKFRAAFSRKRCRNNGIGEEEEDFNQNNIKKHKNNQTILTASQKYHNEETDKIQYQNYKIKTNIGYNNATQISRNSDTSTSSPSIITLANNVNNYTTNSYTHEGSNIIGNTHHHNDETSVIITDNASATDAGWGNDIRFKPAKCIRIAFRNIDHLPERADDFKNASITKDITDGKLDIMGISEVNLAWQKVAQKDKLETRFRKYLTTSKFLAANNQTDSPAGVTTHQWGGTIIGCIGSLVNRIIASGRDTRLLGRWVWMSIRGCRNHMTHVVSIYRPVAGNGPTTTYQQQVAALALEGISTCPRDLFWEDLRKLIAPWQANGDTIIVGGDFNADIRTESIQSFFQELQMVDCITRNHNAPPPNTYDRGSVPIDGIFGSSSLIIHQSGYTDHAWGIGSTHRMAWIDVPCDAFHAGIPSQMPHFSVRKLQIDDPRIVDRYIQNKLQLLLKQNAIKRLKRIYETYESTLVWNSALARELNSIDGIRMRASIQAEQRCRKIKMGNVPWSPDLQECINRIRYYRACIKKYKFGKNINARTMLKMRKQHRGPEARTTSAAQDQLDISFAEYKKLKPHALAIRYNFLADLANAKAGSSGENGVTILNQLQRREEQRRLGMKLRLLKGLNKTGLSSIIAPNNEGEWQQYTEKEDVELKLCEESVRRFTQANNSPCMQVQQINILGQYGESSITNDILEGRDISSTNLHPDFQALAPYYRTPESIKSLGNINLKISNDQYKHGWQRQKERTSSEGQMHFGHFKASIFNATLLEFDRKILELCLRNGHILPRWKRATDVMIPKKLDSIRVDQLRTICLLAADWNFGNKLLGKRLMAHAEKAKSIAPEQYGSRKQKSSILHATNKALLYDIQRQKKDDSAIIVLDAKACYDRIPIHLAALGLLRQGMPQQAVNFMLKPIRNMTHNVRTNFGESKLRYNAADHPAFHGILQGNGAGPCIWVMLSSPLLDHLRHSGHGIKVTDTSNGNIINIPAIGFVDDTDLPTSIPDRTKPLLQPESSVYTWNQDIKSIAAALQGPKCSWQRLIHNYTSNNRWNYQKIDQNDNELEFVSSNGPTIIKRVEYNKATLALGIMFSIDGSMHDEVQHLKEKVVKWCDHLKRHKMTKNEAWYALTAGIMKSLTYPLLATTMSHKQLHEIMVPLLNIALPTMGICRKMSRDLIFCKQEHKGFGIDKLGDIQGVQKLLLLLGRDHVTDTSLLLKESIALCSKQSGIGPGFLLQPFTQKMHAITTPGIVTTLWEFCHNNQIQVHTNLKPRQHIHGDMYLMKEWLIRVPDNHTLLDLNACRLYLRVETLSDILELNGRAIQASSWNGIQTNLEPNWPSQPRPSERAWNSWRRWIAKITNCTTAGMFSNPLSIEYFDSNDWRWLVSDNLEYLFHRLNSGAYEIYQLSRNDRVRRNHGQQYMSIGSITNIIPKRHFVAQVHHVSKLRAIITSYNRAHTTRFFQKPIPEWQECIRMQAVGDIDQLRESFLSHEIILVCDGSFKNGYGAAAYIITTEDMFNVGALTGTARTTGHPEIQDSYRAELTGVLAGLLHFQTLLELWQLQNAPLRLKVVCDNIEALKVSFNVDLHPSISAKYNHYDMLHSIRTFEWDNVSITYEHIYGHQDKKARQLSTLETLNVQMDTNCRVAREYLEKSQHPLNWVATLPNWNYMAILNDQLICKHVEHTIHSSISHNTMQRYFDKKLQISSHTYHSINWLCISKAMATLKGGRCRWISKHHSGMCGVNKWRHIWKDRPDDGCPRCGQTEDASHVHLCKDDEVHHLWIEELNSLETWLDEHNTEPNITTSIICCLELLYKNQSDHNRTHLVSVQQSIGYDRFFEGELHTDWAKQQSSYYSSIHSQCSGTAWCMKLIHKLWDIRRKFWDARNYKEHINDELTLQQKLNQDIENEITIGFEDLNNRYQKQITEKYIEKILQSTNIEVKRSWIRNIQAGRQVTMITPPTSRPVARILDKSQQLVTRFFQPATTSSIRA